MKKLSEVLSVLTTLQACPTCGTGRSRKFDFKNIFLGGTAENIGAN